MAKKKIDYASMFTLRKDGRYQGSYTDARGRHYIYDRDPAKLFQKLQTMADQPEAPPTLRKIAECWERDHREEITARTWNNYEPHYNDILTRHGHKPLQEVTALDIMNHLTAAKTKGYSATVVNSIRSLYRMIFDYAVAHDHAQFNPVLSVRLPKGLKRGKRIAPTDEQIKTIFANVHAPFGLFPLFLLCTGMRKSEALALTWSDVDFKAKEIQVTKSIDYTVGANPKVKPPKTDAGVRTVPIIDVLYDNLLEAYNTRSSDYLFPAQDSNRSGKGGGMMTLRGYEGAWLRYCEVAGFMVDGKPTITAHNLRHGTATLMFELGVDELTAQRILGHSRIEITREIYTDLRAAQNAKSVSKFNKGMRKYLD
ncbi:MAG: tyrosine-type recombinase/integrase [Oscillospiraceae bacterium]|nr:tyrosine-type recombinase/integrase [Oscillospiraceae bacterium]